METPLTRKWRSEEGSDRGLEGARLVRSGWDGSEAEGFLELVCLEDWKDSEEKPGFRGGRPRRWGDPRFTCGRERG